jgi:hypothetical protein
MHESSSNIDAHALARSSIQVSRHVWFLAPPHGICKKNIKISLFACATNNYRKLSNISHSNARGVHLVSVYLCRNLQSKGFKMSCGVVLLVQHASKKVMQGTIDAHTLGSHCDLSIVTCNELADL